MKPRSLLVASATLAPALLWGQIVINESIGSTTGSDGEFIELYNAGGMAVDVSGYSIEIIESDSGGSQGNVDADVVFGPGTSIASEGYLLIANTDADAMSDTPFEGFFPGIMADVVIGDGFLENSSHTIVLKDDLGVVINTVFLTDGDAGDAAHDGTSVITPDLEVGPDGTFLPAGFYRGPDGSATAFFQSFGDPASVGTPGSANPEGTQLTLSLDMASISENGGSLTATISRPGTTGNLDVTISVDDSTEAEVASSPVTILDGTDEVQVAINAVDDLFPDGTQTVTVSVVATGAAGDAQTFDVTDDGADTFSLVVNEVYYAPDPTDGDVNGDTVVNTNNNSNDEFIEIVNVTGSTIDLTDYTLQDSFGEIHIFAPGTLLDPGCAILVFGGPGVAEGHTAAFGEAEVQVSTNNGLFLNDTGDVLSLYDVNGDEIYSVELPGVSGSTADGSYNLATELDASSGYGRHATQAGSPANQYSPGTARDGTPFCDVVETITVTVSPDPVAEDAGPSAVTATVTLSAPVPSGLLFGGQVFRLLVDDDSELTPDSVEVFILEGETSPGAPVTLSVVDDGSPDGDQTVTVTVAGSNYLSGSDTVEVTDVGGAPLFAGIINEIHYDPASDLSGDANGDGTRDGSEDEFVEIVNTGSESFDLAGYEIHDAVGLRHVFEDPTILAPGQAVVVFGGGTPTGTFGGSIVQLASAGFLGLNNGGDTVTLKDPGGFTVIDEVIYAGSLADEALTRDPDLTGGTFVAHSGATGSGGALFSPGTKIDGTSFTGGVTPGGGDIEITAIALISGGTEVQIDFTGPASSNFILKASQTLADGFPFDVSPTGGSLSTDGAGNGMVQFSFVPGTFFFQLEELEIAF